MAKLVNLKLKIGCDEKSRPIKLAGDALFNFATRPEKPQRYRDI
jgi:hypothetical protein